ncbi:MAG: hypothetical protein FD126_3177, partial [Elusimicrobia bacterium]
MNLGSSYAAVPDAAPLFARRDPLLKEVRALLSHLNPLIDEYNSLRSGADANSVAMMINSFVSGKGIPSGMEGAYFHYNDGLEFGRTMRERTDLYARSLLAEETQYKAALHAQEVQRRWVLWTSVGGGVLVLLIGGLLFWRHKTAPGTIYITSPTGQPMMVDSSGAVS